MRSQPSVPLGFALLTGVALLAGVGAGFAMTPVGRGESVSPSSTAPPPTPQSALATTTTTTLAAASEARSVIGPRCLVRSTQHMDGFETTPGFIAGTDSGLVALVARAFATNPIIGTLASLQATIQQQPGTRGVLLLQERPDAEELARSILKDTSSEGRPQVIFVRSSADYVAPDPTVYPSVVLVAGNEDRIYATELAVTSLIRDGSEACRLTPTQNTRGGLS